ncbi:hypothetical protein EV122DRAFT_277757 [Schizophyllum commune]
MGRALYSSRYTKAHQNQVEQQVQTNPAPAQDPAADATAPAAEPAVAVYEKWSPLNPFDPDSDEFFIDAEYEAFVDDEHPQPEPVVRVEIIPQRNVSPISSGSSSSASEDGDREEGANGSPMAVGVDPASLLAGVYSPGDWERRFLLAGAGGVPPQPWLQMDHYIRPVVSARRQPLRARASSLSFLPTSAPSARTAILQPSVVRDSHAGYTVVPPPASLPSSEPSPDDDDLESPLPLPPPFMPPRGEAHRLYGHDSRSALPTVSPTVERRTPADRATPVSSSPPSNPLTNPNARMSHSRISPRVPLTAM